MLNRKVVMPTESCVTVLRAAVVEGLAERAPFESGPCEADQVAIAIEVDEAEDAGNQVGDARREARAEDAEAEVCEEQVVEARVRQARKHGDDEALYRPSVCDEEGVEENHERGEREERQQRVEVAAAVRHEPPTRRRAARAGCHRRQSSAWPVLWRARLSSR